MADNTVMNSGTGGDTIRDKDRSSVKTQVTGVDVNISGASEILQAGETRDGGTGGGGYVIPRPKTTQIQIASAGLTTASTAYAANDQLGTILTFTNAVPASAGTGLIQSALLVDKAAIVGACDLYLFDRSVTLSADNAAADFSDSDMLFCQGVINFPTPLQAKSSPSNAFAQAHNLGISIKPNATSLFGALVTRLAAGHTFFGAVGDLVVTLTIQQD